MEKEQASNARSRLTLDLSTRLTSALNEYAEKHGITKAEALRNAVDLLLVADSATEDGLKVGAWGGSEANRIERQFVGI